VDPEVVLDAEDTENGHCSTDKEMGDAKHGMIIPQVGDTLKAQILMGEIMVEEFRVIFWNVWASNQAQQARLDLLCARLGELIEVYSPDVFGLNEVVFDEEAGWSQVVRYLETRGYQVHFVPHGPEGLGMLAGSALATRSMPQRVLEPVLGPDKTAEYRGFPGHDVRAIDAVIPVGEGDAQIQLIVAYWAHLVPQNWEAHRMHVRAFSEHLLAEASGPLIMGGDFNELKGMPAIRALARKYNRITGNFWRPTWRWAGQRRRLLRANYDNILWSRENGIELVDFKVLPFAPSDHAPLYAKFLITQ